MNTHGDINPEKSGEIARETIFQQKSEARSSPAKRVNKIISRMLSDDNLTKKASLNALTSGLDYAVRLVVGFAVTPLLVMGLGDFYYGAWQVLKSLVGYLSPATGRPTQALKMTLANKQGKASDEEKRAYVGSALAVLGLFLPLTAILGGVMTWYFPYWLGAPVETHGPLRAATALMAANLFIYAIGNIPQSVLEGENLGYKRMGLSAAMGLALGGFIWLAIHFKLGIAGVSAAYLANTLLTALLFLQVARNFTPWFGACKPSIAAVRQFLGLSWWFLAWSVIGNLIMASDVVVLGFLDSAESVTKYSVTKYAPETLISFVAVVVFGIIPGLGGIIGSGDKEKAKKVRNEIMTLTWLIVTVLGASILLWNRTFVQLWIGTKEYAGDLTTLLMVITVTQFVLIRNDANVIDLTLNLKRKVLMGVLSVTVSILLAGMMVGYFHFGIVGLIIGTITGRAVLSIDYPMMAGRFLGYPFREQLKGAMRPALAGFVLFIFAYFVGGLLPTAEWHGLGGWVVFVSLYAVTFLILTPLAFFAGLSERQRNQTLLRARISAGKSIHPRQRGNKSK
jgi:O-antigen/teichoic acid export membrane protein